MSLRLSFELTDRDLRFFRNALRRSRNVVTSADESEIIDAIRGVIDDIRQSEPLPDFVATRLPELESMLQMLADEEWQLPAADRERILAAFVYFGDPEDILPDEIPVIGYLDDVIILNSSRASCSMFGKPTKTTAGFARNSTANMMAVSMPRSVATAWIADGKLKMREQVEEGIESFPRALEMLFTGGNTGKLLVKI